MKLRFDKADWQMAVADLIASEDGQPAAESLVSLICLTVLNSGTGLLVFHKSAPPDVLHHSLAPTSERHYLDRYLAGPYLLDPLYQLALSDAKPNMCRFRDTTPDRFHSSEYFRQYRERTHLVDEMDFLLGISPESTVVMVVGRMKKRFSRSELSRLRLIEPIIRSAMQKVWNGFSGHRPTDSRDQGMHQRLTTCFENFGETTLTQREREITQLLLRGHSSKSIARELGIAPGTVMVHKRNLFGKLGITSQYQLFSQFIDALSES